MGRWSGRGTHRGDWVVPTMGPVPATGKRVTFTGMTTARVANGKIVEDWVYWDTQSVLQQLGATQPSTQARR